MTMLHTVNKSPFEKSTLDSCVLHAKKGSSVLLIEDGIYGAMRGTQKSALIEEAMTNIKFYVLGPDLTARGIKSSQLIDGIKIVDYSGFVDLAAEHISTQAWL